MSTYLKKVKNALEVQLKNHPELINYAVPDTWVSFDYDGDKIVVPDGHVLINPYAFYTKLIKDVYLPNAQKELTSYYLSHGPEKGLSNGNWIRKSHIYSLMIRTSASYDHDRTGQLEDKNLYDLKDTGTFIKMLAYLPTLKRMGVDVLYMLPIAKYSLKDKKGELGSPYGVSNFFKLDEGLKDPMTGAETSVEDEFRAFVEAAHALDMKVMIDIIPRTNSVNSDLIADHPDWFYWIDLKDLATYKPPVVETLKPTLPAKEVYFKDLFSSPDVEEHLHKFRKNPKELYPEAWKEMIKQYKRKSNKKEILDLVQETFKMTIAPAFSDHINDPQPAWSDVTYFRLYLDHPLNSQPYLKKLGEFEPYILFDVAKASYNPGSKPNMPLWNTLSDIIPFYQKEFGIDGARIDMGHALPNELIDMIISKAREIDPNFCFIAEEMDVDNAKVSMEKGYNMIIGDGFMRESRIQEGSFNAFAYSAQSIESPMFACGETHDTPRLSSRVGGERLTKLMTLFNLFIPNTIPFINSGQEFFEKQPMNTGLDCDETSALVLDPLDPFYGKLALFDRYQLHYLHPKRHEMIELLEEVNILRKSMMDALLKPDKALPLGFSAPWDMAAGFGYQLRGKVLLIVGNTDLTQKKRHIVRLDNLPEAYITEGQVVKTRFSSEGTPKDEFTQVLNDKTILLDFEAGEMKILEIKS
jgi:starch synthase (maltosyl-transferring)